MECFRVPYPLVCVDPVLPSGDGKLFHASILRPVCFFDFFLASILCAFWSSGWLYNSVCIICMHSNNPDLSSTRRA